MANECPAENVGGPHCRGYGNLNLKENHLKELEPCNYCKLNRGMRIKSYYRPWRSRYEIRSICPATELSFVRFVSVGPTSC